MLFLPRPAEIFSGEAIREPGRDFETLQDRGQPCRSHGPQRTCDFGLAASGEPFRESLAVSRVQIVRITGNGESAPIDAYHHRRYPFAKFSPRPDAWPRSA
jgi:hypothetical protein